MLHVCIGCTVSVAPVAMGVRDNELDKLDSQPLHVSGSGGVGERVLDPSPSDGVLRASTGQVGVPQGEVLDSSPSFSPLSRTESCGTPSSDVSCDVECSAGDGLASLISDSRPLRSRIPVKIPCVGASGDSQPLCVTRGDSSYGCSS